jgi:hypothetical protein
VLLRVQGGSLPELDILLRREHVPAGLQLGALRHCARNACETKNSEQGSAPNENVEFPYQMLPFAIVLEFGFLSQELHRDLFSGLLYTGTQRNEKARVNFHPGRAGPVR